MKKIARYVTLLLFIVMFSASAVNGQTTVFTYNGKLPDDYNQPTAQYDFQFNLYDEATGSNSPLNSTPITLEDVQVTNGAFAVLLDFGNLFDGSNRYLEIGERPGNSTGTFTILSSRHQILSLPYTIRSLSAATADTATNAQSLGGTNANVFVQNTDSRLSDPREPAPGSNNYIQNRTSPQSGANFNISGSGVVGGNFSVSGTLNANGSGLTNLNATNITTGTLNNARLGLIPAANIAEGAISTSKIAGSAVTAAKIANNQVVRSLNGLTDSVNLAAGANVTITPSGNTLTISASTAGGNFISNTTTQQANSNFNISGSGTAANLTASSTLSGNVVNATTQYNIGGVRVLRADGTNTVAGFTAGDSLSSGLYNSFFGSESGSNNTTGHTNAFFGTSAGFNTTTGSMNAFLGRSAGYSNTTGEMNTYVGTSAGFYGTTGSNNSFVGTSTGYNNTEGHGNLFFGYGAGYNNITGNSNSFIGTNAGTSNTTGSANTLVGVNANVDANNLTYATALGADATVSSSNTVVLGRSSGSDTVLIPGLLRLNMLGTAGINHLCRNASNQLAACSSSLRYKTDIAPFSSGLNLVQRLRPITFTWKEGGLKDMGFGAEEIAAVEPLLVTYNANGAVEGVKYDRISAVLVNAVKEQQTQIEVQQTQLTQQRVAIETQEQHLRQQQITIDGLKKLLCNQNPKADVCQNK